MYGNTLGRLLVDFCPVVYVFECNHRFRTVYRFNAMRCFGMAVPHAQLHSHMSFELPWVDGPLHHNYFHSFNLELDANIQIEIFSILSFVNGALIRLSNCSRLWSKYCMCCDSDMEIKFGFIIIDSLTAPPLRCVHQHHVIDKAHDRKVYYQKILYGMNSIIHRYALEANWECWRELCSSVHVYALTTSTTHTRWFSNFIHCVFLSFFSILFEFR